MSSNTHNQDQAATLRELVEGTAPQIFAIASGKGGVGKSSVSVNLACQLGAAGKKVLLFDADYGLGNTDILLGIKTNASLIEALKEGKTLEEIAIPVGDNTGVTMIPGGSGSFRLANADSMALEHFFFQLEKMADRYNYVILDTGAGIGERTRDTLLFADKILIVTTSDPASITDSYATIKVVARRDPQKKFGIIVNRAENRSQAEKVFAQLAHVAKKYLEIDLEYVGMIPEDEQMKQAIRRQQAVVLCYPGAASSSSFQKIASRLTGEASVAGGKTFTRFIKQFFKGEELS